MSEVQEKPFVSIKDAFRKSLDRLEQEAAKANEEAAPEKPVEEKEQSSEDMVREPAKENPKEPYTPEEIAELAKDPKFLEKVDMERLGDDSLKKKKAAMDEFFRRKATEEAEKRKALEGMELKLRQSTEEALALAKQYQEAIDALKEEYGDIGKSELSEAAQKLRMEERDVRERDAIMWARERMTDWDEISDEERYAIARENPILLDLANEQNGKYLRIVVEALHRLAREKRESFEARVERLAKERLNQLIQEYKAKANANTTALSKSAITEKPPKQTTVHSKKDRHTGPAHYDIRRGFVEAGLQFIKNHKGE